MKHGTVTAYTNHLCRCDECRAAWREVQRRGNASRAARLAADPSLVPHGKPSTYENWGCRCALCTAAHSAKRRDQHARRSEASGE